MRQPVPPFYSFTCEDSHFADFVLLCDRRSDSPGRGYSSNSTSNRQGLAGVGKHPGATKLASEKLV